jgi:hypothetical protein
MAVQSHTSPAIRIFASNLFRSVLLFAIDPRPHFIELKPLAAQIPKHAVLIIGANFANFHENAHNGFLRSARHTDRGANRATFNQAVDNLCASSRIKAIHSKHTILNRFSIVNVKRAAVVAKYRCCKKLLVE